MGVHHHHLNELTCLQVPLVKGFLLSLSVIDGRFKKGCLTQLIGNNFQSNILWYTYLNYDFKKGGWSPEEDQLLCEAEKIFGNRWTEISKVVSRRTDNTVKNRFSTLCKKRAKHEALAKENIASNINLNNNRVIFRNGFNTTRISETATPLKKMRETRIPDLPEKCRQGEKLPRKYGTKTNQ